ncbi:hypothetical protein IWY39_002211 [Sphingobium sp. JAI105]|uniref:aKG-HExxH-type peptide beta-hydroxylase n=1 Tax=Sphingobium sp. JAI105 TaxID=2787715 RepID=UPI0018CA9390|nr:hypothetical protein [Sphingobium sp. JAI105]
MADAPIWSPGLAARLARGFRRAPTASTELLAHEGRYGSWAWLTEGAAEGRYTSPASHLKRARFELLPQEGRRRYEAIGLAISPHLPRADEIALVDEAIEQLLPAPGLIDAVDALVRSIHKLDSEGPGYDVSHSDPELPFSIFLTLPVGETDAALRVAEALLHETMHLQLTLMERLRPLVADPAATTHSPWQGKARPLQGLIHGLFVFRAIDEWLATLQTADPALDDHPYADRRRLEIADEIASIENFTASSALTPRGQRFARMLLAR